MRKLNGRDLKVLTLLAVVLPVSLLVSFRLAGILQEPKTIIETITLEAVEWEIERPDVIWGPINEIVQNTYTDDGCSILFDILIASYITGPDRYGGSDFLSLGAEVKANVSEGFVEGLRISFSENYSGSQIDILEQDFPISENLETRNVVDYVDGAGGIGEGLKGYVEADGVNKPSHVYYRIWVDWILRSPENESHEMEVSLQLTYNNGTAFKKVVLPIILKLSEDAGDTFETAKEISFGNYTGWIRITTDPEDFFKVWMEEGKTVNIHLSPKPYLGKILELHFYNTSRDLVASACSEIQEEITYTINQSGWWYIRVVNPHSGFTQYELSIQES
ncbi:MAG: hypothetical protein ACUVRA_01890 [Candidatus Bathyarchaeaceae archaeon]